MIAAQNIFTGFTKIIKKRKKKKRPYFGNTGFGPQILWDGKMANNYNAAFDKSKLKYYHNFETNRSVTILEQIQNRIVLIWRHSNMKTKS